MRWIGVVASLCAAIGLSGCGTIISKISGNAAESISAEPLSVTPDQITQA